MGLCMAIVNAPAHYSLIIYLMKTQNSYVTLFTMKFPISLQSHENIHSKGWYLGSIKIKNQNFISQQKETRLYFSSSHIEFT